MGVDKVLLFVRSIDRAEREAIRIELEEYDGANGLTEDWAKVGRVCQRMDDERAGRARRKTRDSAPSLQEEGEREKVAARLDFETRIAEAYTALEAMLEDGERMRLESEAEGANLPDEMAEDRYDGTAGEGAEEDALSDNGERTAKYKTEDPIAGMKRKLRQFRAPQPETPDIGQSNPGGVWAIRRRTTTYREEPLAMDKSAKRKDDSTSLPTLAPEMMAIGSRYPRESLEEEGGGVNLELL